jgi:excinuclease ABC subunit A
VVEHDEETMRAADWIMDLGPGAGEHGGLVAAGPSRPFMAHPDSLTGAYLRGAADPPSPANAGPATAST